MSHSLQSPSCICGDALSKHVRKGKNPMYSDSIRVVCKCNLCHQTIIEGEAWWHCDLGGNHTSHPSGYDICFLCIRLLHNKMPHAVHNADQISCEGSIKSCKHLKRLLYTTNNIMSISEPFNIVSIIDDYLHLIQTHDTDDDFDHIVMALAPCNITNCIQFREHYRNRRNCTQHYATTNQQILRKMHCYFYHSIDIGHRISVKAKTRIDAQIRDHKLNRNDEVDIRQFVLDQYVIEMKNTLKSKQNVKDRMISKRKYKLLVEEQKIEDTTPMYEVGILFDYDLDDYHVDIPPDAVDKIFNIEFKKAEIKPFYDSLKEEMLQNKPYALNIEQYYHEYIKATKHFESQYLKQMYSGMELEHILSIMIYCNYDEFQTAFCNSYRKQNVDDHEHFYFVASFLLVAVNKFGVKFRQDNEKPHIERSYRGIHNKLLLNEMTFEFLKTYCPMSTTTSFPVAMSFAGEGGMVACFIETPKTLSVYLCNKYLPCAWLSDYPSEKEYLFLQSRTQFMITGIIDTLYGFNFNVIHNALHYIDWFMRGNTMDVMVSDEMKYLMSIIMQNQMSYQCSDYQRQELINTNGFVRDTCNRFFMNKKEWFCPYTWQCVYNYDEGNPDEDMLGIFLYSKHIINLPKVLFLYPNLVVAHLVNVDVTRPLLRQVLKDLKSAKKCKLQEVRVEAEDKRCPLDWCTQNLTNELSIMCRDAEIKAFMMADLSKCSVSVIIGDEMDLIYQTLPKLGLRYFNDLNREIYEKMNALIINELSNDIKNMDSTVSTTDQMHFHTFCDNLDTFEIHLDAITLNSEWKKLSLLTRFDLQRIHALFPCLDLLVIQGMNQNAKILDQIVEYFSIMDNPIPTIHIHKMVIFGKAEMDTESRSFLGAYATKLSVFGYGIEETLYRGNYVNISFKCDEAIEQFEQLLQNLKQHPDDEFKDQMLRNLSEILVNNEKLPILFNNAISYVVSNRKKLRNSFKSFVVHCHKQIDCVAFKRK